MKTCDVCGGLIGEPGEAIAGTPCKCLLPPALGSELADALRERDAYFAEAARTKETLALIIPALERASGANADELRATAVGEPTPDEWAALWMARTIMEAPNAKLSGGGDKH